MWHGRHGYWATIPSVRIIVASYSYGLAIKHSLDTRDIMQSDWYRKMFPETVISYGKNTQRKFTTSRFGFRYATSVGGTITGEGADIIILDDPQTPMQVYNPNLRRKVNEWYDHTLSSRLNNRKNGKIIMVMQRLHHEDLTQYLIDKNLFKCLSIPIIADQVKEYEINHWKFTVSAGTTLNQMNRRDLDELKAELGSSAYNAQYLQQPLNQTSLLFKATWIRRYNQIPPMGLVVQSWDCAAKAGINNDYSVCTTWKIDGNNYYLLNVIRQKVSYVELRWLTINAANDYQADVVLIEDKASGQQLIQELTTIMPQPIIPIIPKIDKMTRALSVSPIFESGRVYLPVNQTWLAEYEAELFGFPNCQYDDQMDSTSQLLLWINQRTVGPTMRIL